MKTAQKIVVWGGAFLLTLSVIAGVLLLTIPAPTENIDHQLTAAAAITYTTVNLTADDADNRSKINSASSSGNYRYVMTADWAPSTMINFSGDAVVFDLNGYTYTVAGTNAPGMFRVQCTTFELTDTSAAGRGTIIVPKNNVFLAVMDNNSKTQQVVIAGGNMTGGKIHLYHANLEFRGGNYANNDLSDTQGLVWRQNLATQTLTMASWMDATYTNGLLRSVVTRDFEYEHDGQVYRSVYLTDDHQGNLAKVQAPKNGDTGNYRYVLTADWTFATDQRNIDLYGGALLIDLNGYTITMNPTTNSALWFKSTQAEVTDTSAAGTGRIIGATNGNAVIFATEAPCRKLVISGGRCDGGVMHIYAGDVVLRGGSYTCPSATANSGRGLFYLKSGTQTITYAPYLRTESFGAKHNRSVSTYDAYVLSTSDFVMGHYNYEFVPAGVLSAAQFLRYSVPADRTYYLWARDTDGNYTYLNCQYVGGVLVNEYLVLPNIIG